MMMNRSVVSYPKQLILLPLIVFTLAAIKRKYQGLRRQFLIDENSDGESVSVELSKKRSIDQEFIG